MHWRKCCRKCCSCTSGGKKPSEDTMSISPWLSQCVTLHILVCTSTFRKHWNPWVWNSTLVWPLLNLSVCKISASRQHFYGSDQLDQHALTKKCAVSNVDYCTDHVVSPCHLKVQSWILMQSTFLANSASISSATCLLAVCSVCMLKNKWCLSSARPWLCKLGNQESSWDRAKQHCPSQSEAGLVFQPVTGHGEGEGGRVCHCLCSCFAIARPWMMVGCFGGSTQGRCAFV